MTPMQMIYWKINSVGLVKKHEDWVALLKQAKTGDTEAFEKLVMNCVPTVIKFARQKVKITGRYDLYDDLFQEGVKAVIRAFLACNANGECFFLTYATYWIKGQMTNFLRKSKAVHIPCHHQRDIIISTISVDAQKDENRGLLETMAANIPSPDIACMEAAEKENLKKCLCCLPEQERQAVEIIFDFTWESMKIGERAEKMKLHRNTIRKRAKRGFNKLCNLFDLA